MSSSTTTTTRSKKRKQTSAVKPAAKEPTDREEFTADWAVGLPIDSRIRISNIQKSLWGELATYGAEQVQSARTTRSDPRSSYSACKDGKIYMSVGAARREILYQMESVAHCESVCARLREVIDLQKAAYLKARGVGKMDWRTDHPKWSTEDTQALTIEWSGYKRLVAEYHKWAALSGDVAKPFAWDDVSRAPHDSMSHAIDLCNRFGKHLADTEAEFAATVEEGHIYNMLCIECRWRQRDIDVNAAKDGDDDDTTEL